MQSISRRELICGSGSVLLLAAGNARAKAQGTTNWPSKPVRIIVNYAPGGGSDNAARPFTDRLSRTVGQQFVVDNKGGASGALGIEAVTKATPDGYTFLATPSLSVVILPHLRKVPYDPLKDLVPVTQFAEGTLLVAVHPSVPVKSVQELAAYAKANPGLLSWGTPGVGSYGHLICETFKAEAGVDILHVPYRATGEALADFLAGVVQIHADPVTLPHVAAGKARLLAVLGRDRRPDFPDVPLLKEIYPALDFRVWFAMFAPPGTPPSIIGSMSQEMNKVARDPELRQNLFNVALAPNAGTPEELEVLLRNDYERYGKIVRQFNISAQ
jgi:tripartite-type tricarboxylate transporter receptor subunit TctC